MADIATLFVYGTLRSDFDHPMAALLKSASSFLGQGYFYGLLYDLGPYPAAVASEDKESMVKGDIYALNEEENLLRVMDKYEGVGEGQEGVLEYKREKVKSYLYQGGEYWSWAYLYNGYTDHLLPIAGGDYLQYLKEKDQLGY